jgi:glycosyltransferase involved in cell wall biosynthesis
MSQPRITICLPTYNGGRQLRECLDSLLGQTLGDFDVVAVDDCSSDSTWEILCEFSTRDKRFRVDRNERNLGLVENWNQCIRLAHGEWVKFMFQDDLLAPQCVERLASAATEANHMIACDREFLFEHGITDSIQSFYQNHRRLVQDTYAANSTVTAEQYCEFVLDNIGANLVGEPTVVMLRRAVFQRFGYFDAELVMSCDLEYWNRVAIHTGITFIREPLATFRVHEGATSATNRKSRRFRMDHLDTIIILDRMCRSPMYAPLRQAALSRKPPFALEERLFQRAHRAKAAAEKLLSEGDNSAIRQWDQFIERYPHLAQLQNAPTRPNSGRTPVEGWRRRLRRILSRWPTGPADQE